MVEICHLDASVRPEAADRDVGMPRRRGTCIFCHDGLTTSCIHGGFFGNDVVAGAQAEAVRVPQADGTLVVLPVGEDDALLPPLLTLSDVMGTGHHAAIAAKVGPGKTAAVVGDGAVGLCGVIAARRLGAEQIILLGRHADRIAAAAQRAGGYILPTDQSPDWAQGACRESVSCVRMPDPCIYWIVEPQTNNL
jgi:threonine dehydrogenase-like Zn-dependent dehydrogenase